MHELAPMSSSSSKGIKHGYTRKPNNSQQSWQHKHTLQQAWKMIHRRKWQLSAITAAALQPCPCCLPFRDLLCFFTSDRLQCIALSCFPMTPACPSLQQHLIEAACTLWSGHPLGFSTELRSLDVLKHGWSVWSCRHRKTRTNDSELSCLTFYFSLYWATWL